MEFQGKDKTLKNPAKFIAEESFFFGGKTIPKGSWVEQFETLNFGWTKWIDYNTDKFHLAKE